MYWYLMQSKNLFHYTPIYIQGIQMVLRFYIQVQSNLKAIWTLCNLQILTVKKNKAQLFDNLTLPDFSYKKTMKTS